MCKASFTDSYNNDDDVNQHYHGIGISHSEDETLYDLKYVSSEGGNNITPKPSHYQRPSFQISSSKQSDVKNDENVRNDGLKNGSKDGENGLPSVIYVIQSKYYDEKIIKKK